jgi:hypothetical protein
MTIGQPHAARLDRDRRLAAPHGRVRGVERALGVARALAVDHDVVEAECEREALAGGPQ